VFFDGARTLSSAVCSAWRTAPRICAAAVSLETSVFVNQTLAVAAHTANAPSAVAFHTRIAVNLARTRH
jgi:hypothetical protein